MVIKLENNYVIRKGNHVLTLSIEKDGDYEVLMSASRPTWDEYGDVVFYCYEEAFDFYMGDHFVTGLPKTVEESWLNELDIFATKLKTMWDDYETHKKENQLCH